MIKYLGSKRTLLPHILEAVGSVLGAGTVLDLFSGTARVGHALKAAGYRVVSNDHNAYAATLARAYVQADAEDWTEAAGALVREFNALPGRPGYFTETFCEKARFLRPENGARVDAIREAIAQKGLPPELEAVMLVSLMEAADRVDSTTGVQMAFLKAWAPRAFNPLQLRVPALLPRSRHGKGQAHALDAQAAAALEADVAYLDPPYNQHSYLGNYHVWESLVLWDKPEVYGIAAKRLDVRERKSAFNSKAKFRGALAAVLGALRARTVVVSFSDEGYLKRDEMEALLEERVGPVRTVALDYKRYVGAQIGIYNPAGEKVGRPGKLRNTEYLYVATRRAPDAEEGEWSL